MTIKPIRNDDDLRAAFKQLELVFQAPESSEQFDEMEIWVALIEAYERKHYPICPADPIEAIEPAFGGLTRNCTLNNLGCYKIYSTLRISHGG